MDPQAQINALSASLNSLNNQFLALQNVVYSHRHLGYDYTLALLENSHVVNMIDAANISVDASAGNFFSVTLKGNRTLMNPTGAQPGQRFVFEIIQDGTGSRTLAYDTKFVFGTTLPAIVLTTTANKRDFIGAVYDGVADKFYVIAFSAGY